MKFDRMYGWALCAAGLAMAWTASASAAICYVDKNAAGNNTGGSWSNAYKNPQSALGNTGCSEVWVARGAYPPSLASDTTASFKIGPGVAVYGGFVGNETSRNARNPALNVTTLSGLLVSGNSQHIVVMDGTTGTAITATTVLDGFTLTGGKQISGASGGGALLCRGNGSNNECSPTLANLVFDGNHAVSGGAIELDGYSSGKSNPTLTNITFSNNSATSFAGGALYNNAQISGTSSPTLSNVTFSGNSSANYGGAMVNDGSSSGTSKPVLTNVTFSGNSAVNGGAIANLGSSGTSNAKLVNTTFNGNTATSSGGAIYIGSPSNGGSNNTVAINSILWGDSATTSGPEFYSGATGEIEFYDSVVQGGCGGAGCAGSPINVDPNLGSLADNGGPTQTLMPGAGPGTGSSAIDKLSCNDSSEVPATDQRGAARPDSLSTGTTRCDIGAVEANSLAGDLIFANRFGSSPWDKF